MLSNIKSLCGGRPDPLNQTADIEQPDPGSLIAPLTGGLCE